MKIKYVLYTSVLSALFACSANEHHNKDQSGLYFWYDHPAKIWEETVPLGNGRLGMMPDGAIDSEKLVLNDITLWSGGPQDADNPDAAKHLPEIRKLLIEGKNDQAQDLVYKTFMCKGEGSGHANGANIPFGSYETLGNLYIDYQYSGNSKDYKEYRRDLSLDEAVASTSFILNNVKYTREYIADFNQDVLIISLKASQSGQLNFQLGMDRPQAYSTSLDDNGTALLMKGQLTNGTDGNGMRYNARVKIKLNGPGNITGKDGKIGVAGATEAMIIVSATTDYKDTDYESKCKTLLDRAVNCNYEDAKEKHTKAYRNLFDRTKLHLTAEEGKDTIPTDRRQVLFGKTHKDNGLVELYFQYGRYLLISSTRPGLLPPNLQGLWSNTILAPWNGDYHLDINVQMNHWPVEITNLSELHLPLVELTKSLVEPGEKTAKAFYNADGWVAHVITNIWGFTSPGEHPSWGAVNTGGAWLCAHLWEHYDYNRDKEYLKQVYPVLKGSSEFFLDALITEPKHGWLVTAPTNSPENTYYMPGTKKANQVCMGSTMDNQILRELFTNTIKACEILEVDAGFRDSLQNAVAKLPPSRIGSDERLMEWLEEYEEAEPQHRHVSHLYGLYPGNQISPANTPELAEASRKSLERRGDGGTGWSRAWKINFWARLGDGNHAYSVLHSLMSPVSDSDDPAFGKSFPNFFCAHPPFQIDGNFGGCAGIAEMLLQSQTGVIELLPALPDVFEEGSFDGMRARGGVEVSASWTNHRVKTARLKASTDNTFKLRLPSGTDVSRIRFLKDKQSVSPVISGNIADITLKRGEEIKIEFPVD